MISTIRQDVEFERPADDAAAAQASANHVRFLWIPKRRYLAIDGSTPPGDEAFQRTIGRLYQVAYALHFAMRARGIGTPIGHLHGLFWIGDKGPLPVAPFASGAEGVGSMEWRLLMAAPAAAQAADIDAAIAQVRRRQASRAESPNLAVIDWEEGRVAQLLHIGPYDAEYPTIQRLEAAIAAAGLVRTGCHHEIYLSGPSTPPDRTRTVIRQPVTEPASA